MKRGVGIDAGHGAKRMRRRHVGGGHEGPVAISLGQRAHTQFEVGKSAEVAPDW